ncbi:MAG TPA: VOC family protein [Candidatus Dormibacteraeota bacterium]|jgi:hypothetical protein|nr:VOC family protein [Candidatus Dormibacteraeota bacterium]
MSTDETAGSGPLSFQVTVDCGDPHRLSRFWATALRYEVEHRDAQIRELMAAGIATADDAIEFEGELAWRTGAAIRRPAEGPRSGAFRVLFLGVPEPKTVKNRWHLDLNVTVRGEEGAHQRVEAEVGRLRELGATELYRIDSVEGFHVTMADPEGNEFCVQ